MQPETLTSVSSDLAPFLSALPLADFGGEIACDAATLAVFSTDNSIYEVPPQAVLFPKHPDDLDIIAQLAAKHGVTLTARGGGTGTNGQSLTSAVVVDCSRYLTQIESIDPEAGIAVVQPGVILDQLNREAGKHGLFFAPTVSTASRATIGGMAATDASGKGSRVYGQTSDHMQSMDVVLADGQELHATSDPGAAQMPNALGAELSDIVQSNRDEIERVFPKMNRRLTGYNLQQLDAEDGLNLVKLLCGSEGTLALTKRLTVRLLRKPSHRALVVLAYDNMKSALRDVARLVTADPVAIEFIDDKILDLAQQDPVWSLIEPVLGTEQSAPVKGLNFVEISGHSESELVEKIEAFERLSQNQPACVLSSQVVRNAVQIQEIWGLRSKCVGLLGRMDPKKQGTPFVEDAAVPPENLADFVIEFAELLEKRNLSFGMFGHADVGCVHVRPALDLRLSEDADQIRGVSDAVNALAKKHGGLIWGEHGKGFRGEYVPDVFGPVLYRALCRVKNIFDPENRLNPGKIAAPNPDMRLDPLDAVPFRGPKDAQIADQLQVEFELSIKCNGNGQCMGRDFDDAMCPSYKATGDRRRSPKGRSTLLREWARRKTVADQGGARDPLQRFEDQIYPIMADCLGCKACASQCPVKVDVPKMRSRFFESYFQRKSRPIPYRLIALLEPMGPLMRAMPRLSNLAFSILRPVFDRLGLVGLPKVRPASPLSRNVRAVGDQTRVVLVEDFFLGTFDGAVLDAAAEALESLGFTVQRSGVLATGKPGYTIGHRKAFSRAGRKTLNKLAEFERSGAMLVSVEPAFTSMFKHEFSEITQELPAVQPIEEFLTNALKGRTAQKADPAPEVSFSLFTHCSENSAGTASQEAWQRVFGHFGIKVTGQKTGCCGMAGTFGHEAQNLEVSEKLFDLSWREKLANQPENVLVTGFSCRCQTARFTGASPKHPLQVLVPHLKSSGGSCE
ncbi:FAD-binding and (Fe-S)-binding domain-containing protein [Ruegeria sp.]|uniref:FAD-binding and (Fe-S)-binding domain-containing protein n=1 Tax=Ruegeria sp. TaxID=1879320 RepID=UPI003B58F351